MFHLDLVEITQENYTFQLEFIIVIGNTSSIQIYEQKCNQTLIFNIVSNPIQ